MLCGSYGSLEESRELDTDSHRWRSINGNKNPTGTTVREIITFTQELGYKTLPFYEEYIQRYSEDLPTASIEFITEAWLDCDVPKRPSGPRKLTDQVVFKDAYT